MDRQNINYQLGQAIKRVRKSKRITQQELADRVGITRSVLTRYELGQIEVTMSMYVRLCEALGVNYAELMESIK